MYARFPPSFFQIVLRMDWGTLTTLHFCTSAPRYPLPPGFLWCEVNVLLDSDAQELYALLSDNYVEVMEWNAATSSRYSVIDRSVERIFLFRLCWQ